MRFLYLFVIIGCSTRTMVVVFAQLRKLAAIHDVPGTLNLHLIPHTHDDVGWRKTVEQYYYGFNHTMDRRGNVDEILTTTVAALSNHPWRTFTYVETKFFSMWWHEQTLPMQDRVRYLIANGQWSFANGGWCMHDEASTHFIGMMDQTTLGHGFLWHALGVVPRVGWQLDPFGHSFTNAKMASKFGMDALYFGRIDYQDLNWRKHRSECEGLWQVSEKDDIFWGLTGSYGGNYGPPDGFMFDTLFTGDESLINTNSSRLLERVEDFLSQIAVQASQTKDHHVMVTMGSDFTYQQAHYDYSNIDILMSAVMDFQRLDMVNITELFHGDYDAVNMFYSNPEYYTDQKRAAHSNWTTKYDDFFPYSDCDHCFWTGYFTSRTAFKRFARTASAFLLAARLVQAQTTNDDPTNHPLFPLEDALGIAQHHDGISGTAKQHVADDYSKKLAIGMQAASTYVAGALKESLGSPDLHYCELLNETLCEVFEHASATDKTTLVVVVYNALAQSQTSIVRLPVSVDEATPVVFHVHRVDSNNTQAIQPISVFEPLRSVRKHVLTFSTGPLPPIGAVVFRIHKEVTKTTTAPLALNNSNNESMEDAPTKTSRILRTNHPESVELQNGLISAMFDSATGMLIGLGSAGILLSVNHSWGYYTSFDADLNVTRNETDSKQNSGAYIFRPSEPSQDLILLDPTPNGAVFVNTPVGMEVQVSFDEDWLKQTVRVFSDQPYIEIEYTVGPVPIDDGRGREIVSRLCTPIKSDGTFYTDSNGREFMRRQRNERPTWNLDIYEPIAGNYYPVNAATYIQDNETSLAVLVDRTQGGASLLDGSLELMVQRRTVNDDHRGVDEALNETVGGMTPYPPYGNNTRIGEGVIVRGTHRLMIGKGPIGARLARSGMDSAFVEPLVFVGSSSERVEFSEIRQLGLNASLPDNVMLVTFMKLPHQNNTLLVRLAHQYAEREDDDMSQPVEVSLGDLLSDYTVESITEKTLSGNQDLETNVGQKIDWSGKAKRAEPIVSLQDPITLQPMDIRTFEIVVK